MIEVEELRKEYGELVAVDGVGFTAEAGDRHGGFVQRGRLVHAALLFMFVPEGRRRIVAKKSQHFLPFGDRCGSLCRPWGVRCRGFPDHRDLGPGRVMR